MIILKKLFAPKEVRGVLGVLDEAECRFDCPAFKMIRNIVEKAVLANSDDVAKKIRNGLSPRQSAYSMIANVAGDHVESGQYHIYRGVLNPLCMGGDLLQIFDAAVDEMVTIGAVDMEDAEKQKKDIRENMKTVG